MAIAQRSHRDIIVIGASSGGLEALKEIVAGLPADLPAAVFVVVHVPARGTSWLPEILSRAGRLPASHARHNEAIRAGRIYVAPPDFHLLLLGDSRTHVVRGPKENNHRPAIDPLFRSAARFYGPRAVGVVLSGALDDGAAGLFSIKSRGGIAIVQDPEDALFSDMPRAALSVVPADYCVSKGEIPLIIAELSEQSSLQSTGEREAIMDQMKKETELAALNPDTVEDDDKPGTPSVYGCPDCGGVLWELQDDQWLRFRCRVGHAFSAEGLLRSQGESFDSALWSAFRGLQESAALSRRLAKRARDNGRESLAKKFETKSQRSEEQAELIRNLLVNAESSEAQNDANTALVEPEIPDRGPKLKSDLCQT
jgi:two-component system chemotaxis response regulator CheB